MTFFGGILLCTYLAANCSALVHLPKPFLLSAGSFWSYSKALHPRDPFPPCSANALSYGARAPAHKWQWPSLAGSAQLAEAVGLARLPCWARGRELLGLAQILCPWSQGSTAARPVLEGIRGCSADAQPPARPAFVLSFCSLGSGLYHSVGLPLGLWPGARH